MYRASCDNYYVGPALRALNLYQSNNMKENEMGGKCGTHGRQEKCKYDLSG